MPYFDEYIDYYSIVQGVDDKDEAKVVGVEH